VAHRQGWAAVEQEFVQDLDTGKWHCRDQEVVEEEKGLLDKVRDVIEGIIS
jgi:hypothetical protein